MNKFEQVSTDSHQMSLAEDCHWGVLCLMSGWGWGGPMSNVQGAGLKLWTLYSEVQCIMGNGTHVNRQTDTIENTTFPQLRWRVVKIRIDSNCTKQEDFK